MAQSAVKLLLTFLNIRCDFIFSPCFIIQLMNFLVLSNITNSQYSGTPIKWTPMGQNSCPLQ